MGDIDGKRFPLGWSVVAKPCDACKTSASLLFCRTDSTYLCIPCDAKLHGSNIRHERVWMCEVCEQAPACVTCKADAAALCVTCDRDIHTANPLARRHERLPVVPFYNAAFSMVKSTAATSFYDVPTTPAAADDPSSILIGYQGCKKNCCVQDHDESWVPPINTIADSKIEADVKSIELLLSDEDSLLGFDYPLPINDPRPLYNSVADSVVLAHINLKPLEPAPLMQADQSADNHFVIDFSTSNISSFNTSYTAQSNLQVSSTADFDLVSDGSCMPDMSYPFALQMSSNSSNVDLTIGATNGSGQASQLIGLDREARVMRYREKRKNRKFEKTIRYASRKAYAETRPRIKGRFAKRTDNSDAHNADSWFKATSSAAFMGDSKLGWFPRINTNNINPKNINEFQIY